LPLELFRSRTFSAINLLTLALYAALGGALFFLPFALIQVQGFPAALAGTVFLPLTLIMGTLSRWSGGLLDRFGAKWLLVVGPTIASFGFGLLALPIGGQSYWAFLVPMTILGLGMVVTVAPLTTTVIEAVPAHQTGVAAGVNNAVASLANLLAVAVLGAAALGLYDHALDRKLATGGLSAEVQQAVRIARAQFVTAPALSTVQGNDRIIAETILKGALADSIQVMMLVCATLTLGGCRDWHAAARTLAERAQRLIILLCRAITPEPTILLRATRFAGFASAQRAKQDALRSLWRGRGA
jgi:MFS family permease